MILVIKVGGVGDKGASKPGNRGKRDSQVILMNFLSRVMFDDRMSPLDYEIFRKIQMVTGKTADLYEAVLTLDSDTVISRSSITYMTRAFRRDDRIMALCGESRIKNKFGSWVTAIQVFEYYISHHLGKAFESVFGGVTCLPGCFSMYRIKVRKGDLWVPILVNPEILDEYSENVVETLHQKNLLLLGEDRFLTTVLLRTFPRRKTIYLPQAKCETVVPDKFRVLLSQRRRWINSTIHNLIELILVKELCGTFCFSMQFVIFLELLGTVVLPISVLSIIYLIIFSVLSGGVAILPIIILSIMMGLPAILILLTTFDYHYILWMFIYLLALPIWNFVLPIYAFVSTLSSFKLAIVSYVFKIVAL